MDVGRLRVLRELADRGSVTAVAAALSFTPSAISQQLRALTAEVGVPLTEPAGRGLRLTAAGQALVTQAEEVFTALARAQAAVDGLRSLPGGEVRMALFPSGARMLLAGLLRRMAAFPDVAPAVPRRRHDPTRRPRAGRRLRRGRHPPRRAHGRGPGAAVHRGAPAARAAGRRAPARAPARPPPPAAAGELADEPWISVDVGWPVDDVLRALAVQTGTSPRIVQRINDFSVTEELVAAGVGIALLPRYSTDDRGGRRLARRPVAGVRAARVVEAVLRTSTAQRPAVAAVLDALRAEAASLIRARA